MIEKVIIKNYLLLKDIEIDFRESFNILTGETGAGKSILINAVSLLLGERADYSLISRNKEKMVVESIIRTTKNNKKEINEFIKQNNIDYLDGDSIIIRRELYTKGYSRNFINDTPVNINELKTLGDLIGDIHSQNEHQSLLKKDVHIELLDSFLSKQSDINFTKDIKTYREKYDQLVQLHNEHEKFMQRKTELEAKKNFLEFQLKEIGEVDPKPNEDEELEKELKTIENTEVIQSSLDAIYLNLYEDAGSVIERIKVIEKELEKIKEYNDEIQTVLKDISESAGILNEGSKIIYKIRDNLTYDPERIESIRERLYKLQFIKKKYGGSLSEAIAIKDGIEKDLQLLENFDDTISKLEAQVSVLKEELYAQASAISKKRKEKSKKLENEVVKVLNEIGFENAEFKVDFKLIPDNEESSFTVRSKKENVKLTADGIDEVEFLVKINKGDEFSSLRKTASGGEISRIMLALKTVLADADKIDVLIFDEIDAGISGRIAQKVGRVLKKLSGYHQVISVTHLAQIAALSDEHFLVEKEIEKDTTITKIRKLDKNERVIEVAKLLSGEKVTDASIKSAKELISG